MRLPLTLLLLLMALLPLGGGVPQAGAQGDGCGDYDTQAEAQASLDGPDADDDLGLQLDADLDGVACPDLEPGKERSIPLADELPEGLVEAEVVRIVDGDTIKVRFKEGDDEGNIATVRLIGIDTPETKDPNDPVECYGAEATKRLAAMLPPGRTVYLEQDISDTDRYDRLLRYVWFQGKRDGKAYLANEMLVREGFAVVSTFPPDVAHVEEFTHAQEVATFRQAGLWEECGGADTPLSDVATQAPPTRVVAPTVPPAPTQVPLITECATFGSFDEANAYYAVNPAAQPFLDPNLDGRACEVFFGVDQPAAPPPQQAPPSGGGCDPSYPTACIPPPAPYLNCPDVGVTDFTVLQPDPHGFDGDFDGVGCESSASGGSGGGTAPPPSTGGGGGACDPSYPGVCIPPAPPDLDCGDVGFRRFTVLPPDPHGFDGDNDGVGCES